MRVTSRCPRGPQVERFVQATSFCTQVYTAALITVACSQINGDSENVREVRPKAELHASGATQRASAWEPDRSSWSGERPSIGGLITSDRLFGRYVYTPRGASGKRQPSRLSLRTRGFAGAAVARVASVPWRTSAYAGGRRPIPCPILAFGAASALYRFYAPWQNVDAYPPQTLDWNVAALHRRSFPCSRSTSFVTE